MGIQCLSHREEEVHWHQDFLPIIVRGREVLKGRGITCCQVVLSSIGVFEVMAVRCLCLFLVEGMDLGPVQLLDPPLMSYCLSSRWHSR